MKIVVSYCVRGCQYVPRAQFVFILQFISVMTFVGAYQCHHQETVMTPVDANWGGSIS